MKKYKIARKAKVFITEYTGITYSTICPFCKTGLVGGFNENTIRLKCSQCKNEIILI